MIEQSKQLNKRSTFKPSSLVLVCNIVYKFLPLPSSLMKADSSGKRCASQSELTEEAETRKVDPDAAFCQKLKDLIKTNKNPTDRKQKLARLTRLTETWT